MLPWSCRDLFPSDSSSSQGPQSFTPSLLTGPRVSPRMVTVQLKPHVPSNTGNWQERTAKDKRAEINHFMGLFQMNALIGSCILSLCPRHKTTPLYDISRLYGSPMHKLLGEGKEVISSVDKIQNKTTGPNGSNLQLKANSFPLQKFLWITCTFI